MTTRMTSLPRGVAHGVDDAVAAVPALASEGQMVADVVELGAPVDQLLDALRRFANHVLDDLGIAQARRRRRACRRRGSRSGRSGAEHGGDASLGVVAIGLLHAVFGDDDDREAADRPPRRPASPASPPPMISTSVKKCGTRLGWNGTR